VSSALSIKSDDLPRRGAPFLHATMTLENSAAFFNSAFVVTDRMGPPPAATGGRWGIQLTIAALISLKPDSIGDSTCTRASYFCSVAVVGDDESGIDLLAADLNF